MVERCLKAVDKTLRGMLRTQIRTHGRDQCPFTLVAATFGVETITGGANAHAGMRHLCHSAVLAGGDSGEYAVRSIHSCSALPCRGIATFLRIVGKFSFQLRTRAIETAHHCTDFHTLFVSYLLV